MLGGAAGLYGHWAVTALHLGKRVLGRFEAES
jgi:hypothetical protein